MPSRSASIHPAPEVYRQRDYDPRDENTYHYNNMNDPRDQYHHPHPKYTRNDSSIYARPPPRPTKVHWPPSPSVEDEEISLSREHSPSLPELESSEVSMRGSIDQQPIMVEIGREDRSKHGKFQRHKSRQKKGVRFEADSSDESNGPPTPTDSNPPDDGRRQHLRPQARRNTQEVYNDPRPRVPLASPSLQDVISNSVRPRRAGSQVHRLREEEANLHAERTNHGHEKVRHSTSPDEHRHGQARDYFTEQDSMHHEAHYPGTLEELRNRRRDDSKTQHPPLPFAERHRTMSGTSDAADHRPLNMRHMSAMGYYGESQTPSFAKDHPLYLHTSPPPEPSRNAPQFRQPRPSRSRRNTAEDSDSESSLSPDEAPHKGKRRSRNVSNAVEPSPQGYTTKRDYPVTLPTQYAAPPKSRPVTPVDERREALPQHLPDRMAHRAHHDQGIKSARSPRPTPLTSPAGSPRNSYHGTPPSSPKSSSKDGASSKASSPVAAKSPMLPRSFSSSAIGVLSYPTVPQLRCADKHHHASSLYTPSRASSPTLHPPGEPPNERHSRETSKDLDDHRSRRSLSPLPAPMPSRSFRPDLKIDIQGPTPEPPQPAHHSARPVQARMPVGGDISSQHPRSPKAPVSAPFWATDQPDRHSRPVDHAVPQSAQLPSSQRQLPTHGPPARLPACPRPGFVAGHDDWWTLRNAPDLDICPSCKGNLEAAGSTASFVRSPPRSTTYRTRCDLSIPWVRMAWLLILQGKASKSLLVDVITSIAKEKPCPGRTPDVRNWRRLYDPEDRRFIPNFDVCPSCVRCVENLFPNLRGRLEPVPHADREKKRTCSLSFEHPRFARYVDLLDEISAHAHSYRREPNMARFVALARTFSETPPCRRDDQFRGKPWYFIPHLPDFTVCEECYVDIVWPAAHSGSELANLFLTSPQHPPQISGSKLSCQLYSERMRVIFHECSDRNDFPGLRREAMLRVGKERDLQARVEHAKTLPSEWRAHEMEGLIAEWRRWE